MTEQFRETISQVAMTTMLAQTLKTSVQILLSVAVTALCLFVSAGRINWPNAWMLLDLNVCAGVTTTALLSRDPALDAERRNTKAGRNWDKRVLQQFVKNACI